MIYSVKLIILIQLKKNLIIKLYNYYIYYIYYIYYYVAINWTITYLWLPIYDCS